MKKLEPPALIVCGATDTTGRRGSRADRSADEQ